MMGMTAFRLYEVGGCVRDELLGIDSDDVDYSVVPKFSFGTAEEAMEAFKRNYLEPMGFAIFEERPEFYTFRCRVPERSFLRNRTNVADFVIARREGPYSDNRRPDYVLPGTLEDDLSRRDFTINAIAKCSRTGELVDPHNGRVDLANGVLRFVGDPMERIREDGLRVMRAIRFAAVYDLEIPDADYEALTSEESIILLSRQKKERLFMELNKLFARANVQTACNWLGSLPKDLVDSVFSEGLRIAPTMKAMKKI
jgi:tRNA nucleotidyltransferase/poly(A) polymerase